MFAYLSALMSNDVSNDIVQKYSPLFLRSCFVYTAAYPIIVNVVYGRYIYGICLALMPLMLVWGIRYYTRTRYPRDGWLGVYAEWCAYYGMWANVGCMLTDFCNNIANAIMIGDLMFIVTVGIPILCGWLPGVIVWYLRKDTWCEVVDTHWDTLTL